MTTNEDIALDTGDNPVGVVQTRTLLAALGPRWDVQVIRGLEHVLIEGDLVGRCRFSIRHFYPVGNDPICMIEQDAFSKDVATQTIRGYKPVFETADQIQDWAVDRTARITDDDVLDYRLSRAIEERGRVAADAERVNQRLLELVTRRAQLDVQIQDLTALKSDTPPLGRHALLPARSAINA